MEHYDKLSGRLRALRRDRNLTQKELADMIGVTVAAISSYEREDDPRTPPVRVLIQLAETFGVSIDWLCGMNDGKSLNTYQDAIQAFAALGDAFGFTMKAEELDPENPFSFPKYKISLTFDDSTLFEFVQSWEKIYSLYKAETIDHSLYALWLKQECSKSIYKAKIDNELPF